QRTFDPRRRDRDAELLEHVFLADLPRLVEAPALDPLGQQRCRRLRDGAAATMEADIFDPTIGNLEVDADDVAAERVVLLVREGRRVETTVVPRVLVVVEDVLAVELLVLL